MGKREKTRFRLTVQGSGEQGRVQALTEAAWRRYRRGR